MDMVLDMKAHIDFIKRFPLGYVSYRLLIETTEENDKCVLEENRMNK